MPMTKYDYVGKYRLGTRQLHQVIADELRITKDKIRKLRYLPIDSDGELKEAILRQVLRTYIPEAFHIAKGYIHYEYAEKSPQIGLMIINKNQPTLFKDGEFMVVTPDAVEAIVAVKATQDSEELRETAISLSNEVGRIRHSLSKYAPEDKTIQNRCFAGLFVFDREGDLRKYSSKKEVSHHQHLATHHQSLLGALHEAAGGDIKRVINFAALDTTVLARFWEDGQAIRSPVESHVWHSYDLAKDYKNMAQACFIGNLIAHLSKESIVKEQYAWPHIQDEPESDRRFFVSLEGEDVDFFGTG